MDSFIKLMRSKSCSNHKILVDNIRSILALNHSQEKMIEFYVVENQELNYLFQIKPRKKIRKLWQQNDLVYLLDKFGDIFATQVSRLFKVKDESKFEDIFELKASLFSDTLDLITIPSLQIGIQSDDYYKIRVFDLKNVQRFIAFHSFRPLFCCAILEFGDHVLLHYDDHRIYPVLKTQIIKSEMVFMENDFFEIENLEKEIFLEEMQRVSERSFVGFSFDGEKKTMRIFEIEVDLNAKKSKVVGELKVENVETNFFVIHNGVVYLQDKEYAIEKLKNN